MAIESSTSRSKCLLEPNAKTSARVPKSLGQDRFKASHRKTSDWKRYDKTSKKIADSNFELTERELWGWMGRKLHFSRFPRSADQCDALVSRDTHTYMALMARWSWNERFWMLGADLGGPRDRLLRLLVRCDSHLYQQTQIAKRRDTLRKEGLSHSSAIRGGGTNHVRRSNVSRV